MNLDLEPIKEQPVVRIAKARHAVVKAFCQRHGISIRRFVALAIDHFIDDLGSGKIALEKKKDVKPRTNQRAAE